MQPRLALIGVGIVIVAASLLAQPPTFEVVSIKRSTTDRPVTAVDLNLFGALATRSRNGRLALPGVPIGVLIEIAYGVKDFLVQGGPSWLNAERYDIDARAGQTDTLEQMRPMLKAMLGERCKLVLHRETKSLPVYELSLVRGGIKTSSGDCAPPAETVVNGPLPCGSGGVRVRRMNDPEPLERIEAAGISMTRVAEILTNEVDRPVIDRTGFAGTINLRLEFAPSTSSAGSSSGVWLFTALQEQLGLRLTSARGPVEVLVIDHVERPTED